MDWFIDFISFCSSSSHSSSSSSHPSPTPTSHPSLMDSLTQSWEQGYQFPYTTSSHHTYYQDPTDPYSSLHPYTSPYTSPYLSPEAGGLYHPSPLLLPSPPSHSPKCKAEPLEQSAEGLEEEGGWGLGLSPPSLGVQDVLA